MPEEQANEITHSMKYDVSLEWTAESGFKYWPVKFDLIRRTHRDIRESYSFSFDWCDPETRKNHLYTVVLDALEGSTVIVTPDDFDVTVPAFQVTELTHKSICLFGSWIENGWVYIFDIKGINK